MIPTETARPARSNVTRDAEREGDLCEEGGDGVAFELEMNEEWAARLCATFARKQRQSRQPRAKPKLNDASNGSDRVVGGDQHGHHPPPKSAEEQPRALVFRNGDREVMSLEAELNQRFDEQAAMRPNRMVWPELPLVRPS